MKHRKPSALKNSCQHLISSTLAVAMIAAIIGCSRKQAVVTPPTTTKTEAAINCPIGLGWAEGLGAYLMPGATMSTSGTANPPTPDCAFHQWSWETFVWANALNENGTPRFMTMPTPADLLGGAPSTDQFGKRILTLASRAHATKQLEGVIEGAGAIVEADGNMLVAKNGYPVYASVHMNQSYFDTAKANLIINDGYTANADSHFEVGAAVIKATWLRLATGASAPDGAFVTSAQVPVLQVLPNQASATVAPVKGQYETVDVALVGMHVVGHTENHAEFLWGTFEHKLNAPMVPDNTFGPNGSSSSNFTFYEASTSYAEVNQPTQGTQGSPVLSFDSATGTFSPSTNVVQQNLSGGENQPNGVANIAAVNSSSQQYLRSLSNSSQSVFANYNLIGTVWMKYNTYSINSGSENAIGSVALANSTAETFFQVFTNAPLSGVSNCFSCHNATSYTHGLNPQGLPERTIALSHVLAEGSSYAVPNTIFVVAPSD